MNPVPDWYPDPANPTQLRWWDGQNWSKRTVPAPAPSVPTSTNTYSMEPASAAQSSPTAGLSQAYSPVPATSTTNYLPNLIAALLASVGIVVGSIAPWATFMAFSKNGIEGDGAFTLALGIVSTIALFSILSRGGVSRIGDRWIGVGAGVICLVVCIVDIMNITSATTEVFDRTIGAQVGWGLWLTALASAVLCLTGLTVAKQTRRK